MMDVDAFTQANADTWDRLERLAKSSRLTGAGADELATLYQRTATHLSQLRTAAPDPALVSRLSVLLASAQGRLTGAHEPSLTILRRFIQVSMPVALYRIRWWILGVTVVCVSLGALAGVWVNVKPETLELLGSASEREHYVDEAFASYYSEYSNAGFGAMVWTNNAWIALLCIATGICGVFPAYVLVTNAVSVGTMGGMMVSYGAAGVFFSLILPHGLLELTSVFTAGAAGLRLFWAWLVPGPFPRSRALAVEGRSAMTVVVATALSLLVSGVIEGFVTPSGLPWWLKIAIGVVAFAGFWVYVWVVGGRAARRGLTAEAEDAQRYVPLAS
ncbi:MAG: stage II sporulation protein M [Bifidobacteriaceae bacterium]|jgi:uncharacterized membrane protein SpoIIM required for sporulation|nr:stage II sporulation protein M [Bifidobacteriaceae bacterium]